MSASSAGGIPLDQPGKATAAEGERRRDLAVHSPRHSRGSGLNSGPEHPQCVSALSLESEMPKMVFSSSTDLQIEGDAFRLIP